MTRCLVVRGLVKEVEEELNKFLSSHPVRVVFMTQSESADHVTVTILFEPAGPEDWADPQESLS